MTELKDNNGYTYCFYFSSKENNLLGQCDYKEKKIKIFLENIYKVVKEKVISKNPDNFVWDDIYEECSNSIINTIVHESLHKAILESATKEIEHFTLQSFSQEILVKKLMDEDVIISNLHNYLLKDFQRYLDFYSTRSRKLNQFNNRLVFVITLLYSSIVFSSLKILTDSNWIINLFVLGFYVYATISYFKK